MGNETYYGHAWTELNILLPLWCSRDCELSTSKEINQVQSLFTNGCKL